MKVAPARDAEHGRGARHRHPANIARHDDRALGDKLADGVAAGVGSWRFIISQSVIVAGWITLNIVALTRHWDPYPFILLNLCFSTQAAYAAPILQLSQNRQTEHDRQRAENDYEVNERTLAEVRKLSLSYTAVAAAVASLTVRLDKPDDGNGLPPR